MPDPPSAIATFTVRGGPLDRHRLDADEAVDEILIGSDTDCRLCLDLPGVSPIHARVWMDLDGVTVHDTHSPRGVYVNDDRVTGQAPLRDRDILWLGPPGDEASVMIECRFALPGGGAVEEAPGAAAVETPSADDALADLVPSGSASADDALADLVPEGIPAGAHPDATLFAIPAPVITNRAEPQLEELLEPEPARAPAPPPPAPAAAPTPAPFAVLSRRVV